MLLFSHFLDFLNYAFVLCTNLFPGDLNALKKTVFVVKEGIQYRIRIDFYVQREIVTGLKYIQKVLRHGIQRKF